MILFCGDPHGYFEHIIEAVQALRPEAVILLGDLQPKRGSSSFRVEFDSENPS